MSIINSGAGNTLLVVSLADLKAFADSLISKTVKVVEAQYQDENYTIEEAAKYLKVTPATVYNYISDGKLTPQKIGGRTLISRFNIQSALNSGAIKKYKHL